MKIIDAHIHCCFDFEPFSETAAFAGHKNTKEHIEKVFAENNIVHAIVMGNISVEPSENKYPKNMSYCVGLDSNCFEKDKKEYFINKVEENLKLRECVGIKIYPGYCQYYVNDEVYAPFYELAAKYNKPVAIHTGALSRPDGKLKYSHPIRIDDIAVDFPKTRFVMCHFGNPFLQEAAAVAEKNSNVSIDLSGLIEGNFDLEDYFKKNKYYINVLKCWINYFGDYKRIMYGSDWPIVNIKKYIEFIKRIIPEKYHEYVFYKNAVEIYGLEEK
jgi:predicted TIM-barrel fold metal-dependent hydrolase